MTRQRSRSSVQLSHATVLKMTRYICVTGGVVSSLGKGIAAASLGAILEGRGLKVAMVKLDPYINVDPGTMSPFQHGQGFATNDGGRGHGGSVPAGGCFPPKGRHGELSPPRPLGVFLSHPRGPPQQFHD